MKGFIRQVLDACKGKTLAVAQRYLKIKRIKISIKGLKKREQAT
jgi:hypothetical protein